MNSQKNSHDHGIDRYHDLPEGGDKSETLKQIYADWAPTYDHDNDHKLGTVSQPNAVKLFARHVDNAELEILDVGCGTGLVGHHLKLQGFKTFDGTDLSKDMLAIAKTRSYRALFAADASKQIDVADQVYGATFCVGVFTHGHLGPDGFGELIRVTQKGGIIVFTVNEGIWDTGGFATEIEKLQRQKIWAVLEQTKMDYMIKENVKAWYVIARVT